MRTTIEIADPILDEVKRIQAREEKTLGAVVSELLAEGIAVRRGRRKAAEPPRFRWVSKRMGARVDLDDKEAVWAILDDDQGLQRR